MAHEPMANPMSVVGCVHSESAETDHMAVPKAKRTAAAKAVLRLTRLRSARCIKTIVIAEAVAAAIADGPMVKVSLPPIR
ncbi:unannotated protein [freshwater metagenome]|uniref:Unannotated protein n=1 Tax=freshwater metagenome TaxID=449393 RepID=A0A6J6WC49_9ZZZZ